MRILSESERVEALGGLPRWQVRGPTLEKTFPLSDPDRVRDFVDDLGMVAEASEHPVSITVSAGEVTVKVGAAINTEGLTDRSVAVAHAVERCYAEQEAGA